MNQNGRRIALSLVAIVLGAGYLMKVIPRETDVGTDEAHSLQIDGSLVTNPLDINELPHNFSPAGLPPYSLLSKNEPEAPPLIKGPFVSGIATPLDGLNADGSTAATGAAHVRGENGSGSKTPPSGSASTTPPHLPVPVNTGNGGNGSNPGFGGGGSSAGGGGGGANSGPTVPPLVGDAPTPGPIPPFGAGPLPPFDFPSAPQGPGGQVPPAIDLPTDPRDLDPKGRNPINDVAGPLPSLQVVIPVEIPDDEPTPSYSVPEAGTTLGLLSLALVAMAACSRWTRRLV